MFGKFFGFFLFSLPGQVTSFSAITVNTAFKRSSGLTEVVWTGQKGNTSNSVQRADEGGELSMNSLSSGPRA